jgi:hypothetical protein
MEVEKLGSFNRLGCKFERHTESTLRTRNMMSSVVSFPLLDATSCALWTCMTTNNRDELKLTTLQKHSCYYGKETRQEQRCKPLPPNRYKGFSVGRGTNSIWQRHKSMTFSTYVSTGKQKSAHISTGKNTSAHTVSVM